MHDLLVTDLALPPVPEPWYVNSGARPRMDVQAYERVKRGVDVVLCLIGLPFALVVLLVCAIAIKLDSRGPVLFVQTRTGRGGRRFPMYKLRTMVHGAEGLRDRYAQLNSLSYPDFKIIDDPRVTRVGSLLRRTSLDELPQIFNILRGDMTIVGPRPTSFSAETYSLWHTTRLEVQPGLTGLWQVSGRDEVDFDERLRLDIAYIRHRGLALDFWILLQTFGTVLSGRGAH